MVAPVALAGARRRPATTLVSPRLLEDGPLDPWTPADRPDRQWPFDEGDEVFASDIGVPDRGEEVELRRRARVAEEVEVGKEAVRRTERVGGTVRREEVRVEEDVDIDADEPSRNR